MRILIVEDEPVLAGQIRKVLSGQGLAVDLVTDGVEAYRAASARAHDMILLDLGLPKMDGMKVIRALRADSIDTPVMVLSARNDWADRVAGLDAGADDYVTKPFRMEELLARVRALLRRKAADQNAVLTRGDLVYDSRTNIVTVDGETVNLTANEIAILSYLFRNQGRLVSGAELARFIYANDFNLRSNTIAVFVNRLRKKLGSDLIKTVRGRGYVIKSGK
ncbi:response regulator transcription factor [Yoonia sp.]|uniref:response regulator transcription factor n=1 Tax=Yoonia sp. TaxID=2212373 RepID=UPI0035C7F6DC